MIESLKNTLDVDQVADTGRGERRRLPHICFVAPRAYPILAGNESIQFIGGAELQQVFVAKGLARRGFQVSMISGDYGQSKDVEISGVRVLRAYRANAGIPVVRFLWPRLTSIWACLKRANADIYYQRTAGVLTGVVSAYCGLHGKKSVFAAAGNPDLEGDTPRIRYRRDRRIFEYGLRHVDRIFVQNDEQARLCREFLGRDSILVPNCFPPPIRPNSSRSGPILWVSTIRPLKRPDLFLNLAEAMPQHRFRMIGGPGAGQELLFDGLKARAAGLPNVEFLGFVPYKDIDSHFEGSAIFVNTSDSEGFPNTFLQAWSHGIPTVSFVDAGARLGCENVGRVVGTFHEMAESISTLLSDEEAFRHESSKCRRYFETHHSPSHVLAIYEKAFLDLWGADSK